MPYVDGLIEDLYYADDFDSRIDLQKYKLSKGYCIPYKLWSEAMKPGVDLILAGKVILSYRENTYETGPPNTVLGSAHEEFDEWLAEQEARMEEILEDETREEDDDDPAPTDFYSATMSVEQLGATPSSGVYRASEPNGQNVSNDWEWSNSSDS
jgi:hypothetical protein